MFHSDSNISVEMSYRVFHEDCRHAFPICIINDHCHRYAVIQSWLIEMSLGMRSNQTRNLTIGHWQRCRCTKTVDRVPFAADTFHTIFIRHLNSFARVAFSELVLCPTPMKSPPADYRTQFALTAQHLYIFVVTSMALLLLLPFQCLFEWTVCLHNWNASAHIVSNYTISICVVCAWQHTNSVYSCELRSFLLFLRCENSFNCFEKYTNDRSGSRSSCVFTKCAKSTKKPKGASIKCELCEWNDGHVNPIRIVFQRNKYPPSY